MRGWRGLVASGGAWLLCEACTSRGVPRDASLREYETAEELWADVDDAVGADVVVRSVKLARTGTRCHSKYCSNHYPPGDEVPCIPCNQCWEELGLAGAEFRWLIDIDGQRIECAGDDCALECPPHMLETWFRLVGHVEPVLGPGEKRVGYALRRVALTPR